MVNNSANDSPFAAVLRGDAPGTVIARDNEKQFAIIASLEPEAAVHWLAMPFESGQSTEEFERGDRERFLQLVDYAISEAKARVGEHPELSGGFTIKFHLGGYETIPHAKLHILSVE
jgi:histidine triad (HIT) family protein